MYLDSYLNLENSFLFFVGISCVQELYEVLPPGFERFVKTHSLAFYAKIRQDMLSKEPVDLDHHLSLQLTEC